MMTLILDSSALFSMEDLPDDDIAVPEGVVNELVKYKDRRIERWGDMLRVSECTQASLKKVRDVAAKSGDAGRLSHTDITVIALAIDLGGIVLTDDFSIQNLCALMNIEYRSVGTAGIKRIEKWNYKCDGCGRWYKEKMNDCPVCGSSMSAHRKR
ncbi:MAG: nucleic acid-binding protein [Methanomassiliicoccaceae archaeon]|nr:nucleic acid-binding protein [Methanomassiliicoccaceae archaeon]